MYSQSMAQRGPAPRAITRTEHKNRLMIDPGILEAMANSAASATVGVAVRSSAPSWKKFIGRLKPVPQPLKGNSAWKSVEISRKHQEIVTAYIEGPFCHGILELLASLRIGDSQKTYEIEARQLGETFVRELQHRLHDKNDLYGPALHEIWQALKAMIELRISKVESSEYVGDAQSLGASLTARRISAVQTAQTRQAVDRDIDEESTGNNRSTKRLTIAAIVPERFQIAESASRSLEIQRLVHLVQGSVQAGYSQIIMPHARDEYRVHLEDLYVNRNLTAIATRELHDFATGMLNEDEAASRNAETYTLSEDEVRDARYVIIGSPGAGKSTFVRHLVYKYCSEDGPHPDMAPFIIELKTYNPSNPKAFHEMIAEHLKSVDHIDADTSTVADLLTIGLGLVIFDGFDEITNLSHRRQAVQAIESFIRRFPLTRVVVTSRPEGYVGATLDPVLFSAYSLPDFTDDQVTEYAQKWFRLTSGVSVVDAASAANAFLRDSAMHAADLRTNPLMLSLLCMVYKYSGYIPENRPRIYEECSELLFERWDSVRHVRPDIEPDTKGRYMVQELAYFFFKSHVTQGGGIEEFRIIQVLQEYLRRNVIDDPEEARRRARNFLDYCAGRAWVLTKVGPSPKGERLFGFTHRTFMEYFIACYLVRQYPDPDKFVTALREFIKNGSSDVIPQIAIQRFDEVAADGVDDCISILLFNSMSITKDLDQTYLPFAVRCMRYISMSPRTLNKIFDAVIKSYLITRSSSLLASLIMPDSNCEYALASYCRHLASIDGGTEENLAMKIGCYHLVLNQRTAWAKAALKELEDFLVANRERLRHKYADTLSVFVRRGRLTVSDFISICGAKQLVMLSPDTSGRPRIGGLFIEALNDLADSAGPPRGPTSATCDWLTHIADHLFSTPSALLPITGDMARFLITNAEHFSDRETLLRVNSPKWSGIRAFALVVMLASIEQDWYADDIALDLSNKVLGPATYDRFRSLRSESAHLSHEALARLQRLKVNDAWLEYAKLWSTGEESVISSSDD